MDENLDMINTECKNFLVFCIGDFSRRTQRQPYFRQLKQPVQNGNLFFTQCNKIHSAIVFVKTKLRHPQIKFWEKLGIFGKFWELAGFLFGIFVHLKILILSLIFRLCTHISTLLQIRQDRFYLRFAFVMFHQFPIPVVNKNGRHATCAK